MANTTNLDLENVIILGDTEYAYNQLVSEIIAKINNNNLKIDEIPVNMIPVTQKGIANGVASLGNDGIIPSNQLPIDSGSVQRVLDITARDAIVNLYDNKLVFVIDATGDITVTSGWAMYIYNSTNLGWTKIIDGESLDIELTWDDIANKPTLFPPETHTHSQIDINAQNIINLENTKVDNLEGSRLVSETEVTVFNDKYSQTEIDNKLSTLETNIDWKESVATFADITMTYPTPVDGWTVNTKDTDYTYRYNGSAWIVISANAIPKATTSVDGLMSKEDKLQVDTNKTDILSAKTTLGSVAMTTTAQTVTGAINEHETQINNFEVKHKSIVISELEPDPEADWDLWFMVAEPELPYIVYDFENDIIGQTPQGFSTIWGSGFTIQEIGEQKAVESQRTSVKRSALICNDIGTVIDIEVKLDVYISSGDSCPSIILRAGGTTGSENGYLARLMRETSSINRYFDIFKYANGSSSQLATTGLNTVIDANTWYTILFKIIGTNLYAKYWIRGTSEPAEWTLTAIDSSLASGGVGIFDALVGTSFIDNFRFRE